MNDLKAVSQRATDGRIGAVGEPKAGEPFAARTHGSDCLDCHCPLVGDYCHCCGQRAVVHRTLSAFLHDLARSVFHLDGKIWRTLLLLAWRPGELSRRYIDGERTKFVSPLALFLFSVLMMFMVFNATGSSLMRFDEAVIAAESRDVEERIPRLERERQILEARGLRTSGIDKLLMKSRAKLEAIEAIRSADERLFGGNIKTGWEKLDQKLTKANQNPQLFAYKIRTNAYKFSWAMIPLSLPFIWFLFINRPAHSHKFGGYEHLVLVTYSAAFMSITLVAFLLLVSAGLNYAVFNFLFLAIPPVHLYCHLKGAYGLSWFSAAWRALTLAIFAAIALGLFGSSLLLFGALG